MMSEEIKRSPLWAEVEVGDRTYFFGNADAEYTAMMDGVTDTRRARKAKGKNTTEVDTANLPAGTVAKMIALFDAAIRDCKVSGEYIDRGFLTDMPSDDKLEAVNVFATRRGKDGEKKGSGSSGSTSD